MNSILLAEDDPMQRALMSTVLEKSGYEVRIAINGAEAVRMASAHIPDLILMDARMPELNGLDATRMLKQQPATAQIPVIMLTAYMLIDTLGAQIYGCDDVMVKPVHFPTLLAKIAQLCQPAQAIALGA